MAWTAKIGGVSVNVIAGSLKIEGAINLRTTGSLGVWSSLGVSWQYGTSVQIYDDSSTLVFAGNLLKDRARRDGGARQGVGYLVHALDITNNCYYADKRLVFKTYANMTAGAIVNDLLTSYLAAESVTGSSATIATGRTIVSAIWPGNKTVSDALAWLAEQSGYWWTIDLNRVLYFQPYGSTPAPFTMDGTMADAVEGLEVEFGNDLYLNKQLVKGSYGETGTLSESFVGNSNSRSFTLSYPLGTLLSLSLNGSDLTTQTLDKGETGGRYYVSDGDPVIAQDPGQTLLTSSDTLTVSYRGRFPVIVSTQNNALITTQRIREGIGSGIVESVYTNTKARTLSAAFDIGNALLSHYGTDASLLSFTTRTSGLAPGQSLLVNLSDFGLSNASALITSVTISDRNDGINIWYDVEAATGPAEASQWPTFWQDLMAQSSDPGDFTDAADTALALVNTVTFTHAPSFTVTATKTTCPIVGNSTMPGGSTIVC